MEIGEKLEKTEDVFRAWEKHINEKIGENLRNAIKHRNQDNTNEIEIKDMGAIDSIEDGVVRCEILNGEILDIPKGDFKFDIEEGDVVNLKLTYKDGNLIKTEVLGKNEEEKQLRLKMMREQMKRIRKKI